VEFAVDLGSGLGWGKKTVLCLSPVIDVIQLKCVRLKCSRVLCV
jgi:hypothetical protein